MKKTLKRYSAFLAAMVLFCLCAAVFSSCGKIPGVSFTDATLTYNGEEQKIEVAGVPEGATVEYSTPNSYKDAGVYEVKAIVTHEGKTQKLKAKLTILPKTLNVEWDEGPYSPTGSAPAVKYTLSGVIEGDEVTLNVTFPENFDFSKNNPSCAITAASANPNYAINESDVSTNIKIAPATHTVKFETGMNKVINDVSVKFNAKVKNPDPLINFGYVFEGWFFNGEQWNFESDTVQGDMTLVAKWTPIKYTVTYYLNGGTNAQGNPTEYTVENDKELLIPHKEGSVFLGWFEDEEFTVPAKRLGSDRKNISLYAKWSNRDFTALTSKDKVDASSPSIDGISNLVSGKFSYYFSANITEFGENGAIYIGRGKNTLDGSYIKITSSRLSAITNTADGQTKVVERGHVRQLLGYVIVEMTASGDSMSVVLHTADGKTVLSDLFWSGRNGEIFFTSENVTLTDATFGWSTNAFDNKIWVLGDDNANDSKLNSWLNNTMAKTYNDFLSFSATGLDSTKAVAAMKEMLAYSKPNYAIWSFAKESGATYDANLAEFIKVCKDNGITPILTTHSTELDAANEAKNLAVKSSGEKYVDFAAVAEYENAIANSDYSAKGSLLMFSTLISECPELMSPGIPVRSDSSALLNSENSKVTLGTNRVRDGKYMIFSAELSGLSEDQFIRIGHGYMVMYSRWFELSDTYLKLYSYTTSGELKLAKTYEHKLNIKDFVHIMINADNDNGGNIVTVVTNGGTFTASGYSWNASNGEIFASAEGGAVLENAELSWTCKDYDKEVWAIGASYFSLSDPARWPYYLYQNGYDSNIFLSGRGGMNSDHGLEDLESALESGYTPKHLVWGVVLNDGADSASGIREKYYKNMLKLMQICQDKGIELYLMAAVNTPTSFNSYKIDYLFNKKEGFANYDYHIINITRAMGAFEEGSGWYEGMIHSDNIHPKTLGAISMYMQFLCDAPVLMGADYSTLTEKTAETLAAGNSIEIPNKKSNESFITLTLDYNDLLAGTIILGNGKTEGGTYLKIDKTVIKVCEIRGGKEVVVETIEHQLSMKHYISIAIHSKNGLATVYAASTGFTGELASSPKLFSFECSWLNNGATYLSLENQSAENVNLKYLTN